MKVLSIASLICGAAMYSCAGCDLHKDTRLVMKGLESSPPLLTKPLTQAGALSTCLEEGLTF